MPDIREINIGTGIYSLNDATARTLGASMLKYTSQNLTSAQQTQARTNIGINKVGTLDIELVTTLNVICAVGTQVTISNGYSPSQTATSVDGKCSFTLPNNEDTIGTWDIYGVYNNVTAESSVAISVLGSVYTVDLDEEWPSAELYVECPVGSLTLTCVNGSETLTATTSAGFYTFSVETTGTWTVTMSAENHRDISKTVTVSQIGSSYYLDMGDWPPSTLRVTHPVGAEVTLHQGSVYVYDTEVVSTTSTRFLTIERVGTWTVDVSDPNGYHQTITKGVNIAEIGVNYSFTNIPTEWDTVLVEVTHPSGASVSCTKGESYVTGSTSGYTTRFYVNATGNWTISVSGTNRAIQTQTVNVTSLTTNGYTVDFDTVWPPAVLTVTHPANANVICTSGNSSVLGDSTSSTVTRFEISTTGKTWTIKASDIDKYHNDVSTTVSVPTTGTNYTATLAWTDILLEATVPGGTTTCTNTSTGATVSLYKSVGNTRQFYVTAGSWRVSTSATGHTAVSATVSNVSVTRATLYEVTVHNGTWADTTITVTHPASATVKWVNGSTTHTQTAGSSTTSSSQLVSVSGQWSITASMTNRDSLTGSTYVNDDFSNTPTVNLGTAWPKCTITVTHPAGATVKFVHSSGTTYTITAGSSTTSSSQVVYLRGSWTITASKTGMQSLSKTQSVTTSTSGTTVSVNLGTAWPNAVITVQVPSGVDSYFMFLYENGTTTQVSASSTTTSSGVITVKYTVYKTGEYIFVVNTQLTFDVDVTNLSASGTAYSIDATAYNLMDEELTSSGYSMYYDYENLSSYISAGSFNGDTITLSPTSFYDVRLLGTDRAINFTGYGFVACIFSSWSVSTSQGAVGLAHNTSKRADGTNSESSLDYRFPSYVSQQGGGSYSSGSDTVCFASLPASGSQYFSVFAVQNGNRGTVSAFVIMN